MRLSRPQQERGAVAGLNGADPLLRSSAWDNVLISILASLCRTAAGMDIADHPLHRSGRAGLPHPAPALGDDAKSLQRMRMTHADFRQIAVDQAVHPLPACAAFLASAAERPVPEARDLESQAADRRAVHGHGIVPHVPFDDGAEPLGHLGDRMVQMCVNPRKSEVSGLPSPRRERFCPADGPTPQPAGLSRRFRKESTQ